MNGPEKKVLYLSFCLLVLGIVVRILPWGLPSIEKFQVGDALVVSNSAESQSQPKMEMDNKFDTDNVKEKGAGLGRKKATKSLPKVLLPIHINTASADMLCALKGVGPKLAEKIIAQREAFGPFKTPKDLQKVPGIGTKKLEAILPGVIFD